MLLYRFIPKIAILSTWRCFLALFGPSRGEKGQKKGKQTNSWQKKLPSKKTYKCWLLCRKKNHGCTIITHRATFVYFWGVFLSPHGKGLFGKILKKKIALQKISKSPAGDLRPLIFLCLCSMYFERPFNLSSFLQNFIILDYI